MKILLSLILVILFIIVGFIPTNLAQSPEATFTGRCCDAPWQGAEF